MSGGARGMMKPMKREEEEKPWKEGHGRRGIRMTREERGNKVRKKRKRQS